VYIAFIYWAMYTIMTVVDEVEVAVIIVVVVW
jgi:hypothetical protein